MFDINAELKKLPVKPGVYLMKDSSGEIIYVGKALILKNRVKSYFTKSKQHTSKTKALVANVESFEYIVTNTELEALILECNLIKLHRPKFNILLKDDKAYPYIKITTNEEYPRIKVARKIENDGAKYYGPYSSGLAVRETIQLIRNIFPIKTCNKVFPRDIDKERPCLNYHIGRCLAPCMSGGISKEEYRTIIEDVCAVINGRYDKVIKKLTDEMKNAAALQNFERAASYRDKIRSLNITNERQKIVFNKAEDIDVIAFAMDQLDVCVQVFKVREGRIIGRESFVLEGKGCEGATDAEILEGFVQRYYENISEIPRELLFETQVNNCDLMLEWLRSLAQHRVEITVPKRGKKFELVKMVKDNALIELRRFSEEKTKEKRQCIEALSNVQSVLNLDSLPLKIEAYDISNNGDTEIVGSRIVFTDGKPDKKLYRRYKINSIKHQDDYAAMAEMLGRRFEKDEELPSLILIDGGLSHIKTIKHVMDRYKVNVPIAGMVKNEKHQSRGLMTLEGVEHDILQQPSLLRFITAIQDETHRFAIEYNRKLTKKRYYTSILDNIHGIGKKRKNSLLTHFGSINRIKVATKQQLMEVEGISHEMADEIIRFFNQFR